jgi:hypothetical protein
MKLDEVIVCSGTAIDAQLCDFLRNRWTHRIHEVSILKSDGI